MARSFKTTALLFVALFVCELVLVSHYNGKASALGKKKIIKKLKDLLPLIALMKSKKRYIVFPIPIPLPLKTQKTHSYAPQESYQPSYPQQQHYAPQQSHEQAYEAPASYQSDSSSDSYGGSSSSSNSNSGANSYGSYSAASDTDAKHSNGASSYAITSSYDESPILDDQQSYSAPASPAQNTNSNANHVSSNSNYPPKASPYSASAAYGASLASQGAYGAATSAGPNGASSQGNVYGAPQAYAPAPESGSYPASAIDSSSSYSSSASAVDSIQGAYGAAAAAAVAPVSSPSYGSKLSAPSTAYGASSVSSY